MALLSFVILLISGAKVLGAPLIVTPGELNSVKIEMEVTLDGLSRTFQLDTGANTTMVKVDKQTLAYESEGKATSTGASGIPIECDLVRPPSLSFETFSFKSVQIRRCDLGKHGHNNLGLDLLSDEVLNFDFKSNQLHFVKNISTDLSLKPLQRLSKGHLKIPVRLGGHQTNALFDTGAQLSSVDRKYVQENPQYFKFVKSEKVGHDIGGHPVYAEIFLLQRLRAGSLELQDVTVLAFDFGHLREYVGVDTPFILGANAIVKADWLIDLVSNQWDVVPHQ